MDIKTSLKAAPVAFQGVGKRDVSEAIKTSAKLQFGVKSDSFLSGKKTVSNHRTAFLTSDVCDT